MDTNKEPEMNKLDLLVSADEEILELAAKGVGINGKYYKGFMHDEWIHGIIFTNLRGEDIIWNPLENDGDALRLAVKLNLNLFSVSGIAYAMETESDGSDEQKVYHEDDPLKAMRRAIVQAAAEIGKIK